MRKLLLTVGLLGLVACSAEEEVLEQDLRIPAAARNTSSLVVGAGVHYSLSSDARNPQPLSEAVVSGKIYAWFKPTSPVAEVRFFVDGQWVEDRTERIAPYALGGDRNGRLLAYDTDQLAVVEHTLKTRVRLKSSDTPRKYVLSFTVGETVAYDPPRVITEGGSYQGHWESTDFDVPAVRIETSDPVVIENSRVRGKGTLIQLAGSNGHLTVRNVTGYGLNPDEFDKGNALVETKVAWNEVINEPYRSRTEDVISLYQTTGASEEDPIKIHNNYIQGSYPADPSRYGHSGGGIILGDAGGGYQHAFNNQVVATTNYGIAIAGGEHNRFYDNRVVSSGHLPDGRYIAGQNVGLYIWNQSDTPFGDAQAYDNVSGWVRIGNEYPTGRNDGWVYENPKEARYDATRWKNNVSIEDRITSETERAEWIRWMQKLNESGVGIGPQ